LKDEQSPEGSLRIAFRQSAQADDESGMLSLKHDEYPSCSLSQTPSVEITVGYGVAAAGAGIGAASLQHCRVFIKQEYASFV
jgi:hypothetical protein